MSTEAKPADSGVSHGRGGAGNIKPDDTEYVDGEIVRQGGSGEGAFSTGRGGVANIGNPGKLAPAGADKDVVPDAALRPSMENADYHVGRGGVGNEHHAKAEEPQAHVGLADKLKFLIMGRRNK